MPRARFHSTVGLTIAGLVFHFYVTGMLAAGELPPAPASFVQDDARLFDAASLEQMTRVLMDLHQSTGVSVYVATSSYQEAAVKRNLAQELAGHWLKKSPGVILTYNRGNGQPGIKASPELWRRHSADEIAQILAAAGRSLGRPEISPEQRIQEAMLLTVEHIRQLEGKRGVKPAVFSGVERKLAALLGATLALSGLTIWLVSFRRRKKISPGSGPYYFPEVTLKTRLGGQFGGGCVGESSAARREPPAA